MRRVRAARRRRGAQAAVARHSALRGRGGGAARLGGAAPVAQATSGEVGGRGRRRRHGRGGRRPGGGWAARRLRWRSARGEAGWRRLGLRGTARRSQCVGPSGVLPAGAAGCSAEVARPSGGRNGLRLGRTTAGEASRAAWPNDGRTARGGTDAARPRLGRQERLQAVRRRRSSGGWDGLRVSAFGLEAEEDEDGAVVFIAVAAGGRRQGRLGWLHAYMHAHTCS